MKLWDAVENEAGWFKAIASNYHDPNEWLNHRDLSVSFTRAGYRTGDAETNLNDMRAMLSLKMTISKRLYFYANAGLMRVRDAELRNASSAMPSVVLEAQPTGLGRWLCADRDNFLKAFFVLLISALWAKDFIVKFWVVVALSAMGAQLVRAYEFHKFLLSHLSDSVAWFVVFLAFTVALYLIRKAFFDRD